MIGCLELDLGSPLEDIVNFARLGEARYSNAARCW